MFVYPAQVAEVMARFPEVSRWQAVVGKAESGADDFRIRVEAENAENGLIERIAEGIRGLIRLRADVEVVPPGTIPESAKRVR